MFWIMMLSALFLSPPSPAPQEADCINGLNPKGSCIFRLPFGLSNRKSRVDVRWGRVCGKSEEMFFFLGKKAKLQFSGIL